MKRPLLFVAILVLGTAFRASAGPDRIVAASDLSAAFSAAGRRPLDLDARSSRDFRAGHGPGILRVDWRDFSESRPCVASYPFGDPARWGFLAPDRASLRDRLRALGLSASRPAVVVGGPSGRGEEGRIAWMLLSLGLPEVALLDGGSPRWQVETPGRVEKGAPRPPPPGDFEPEPQPDRRIRLDALRTALAELAGPLRPGAPVVPCCTGGVRSSLLAVLLEARLGIVAANYDGSLWEWNSRDDLPRETGPWSAAPRGELHSRSWSGWTGLSIWRPIEQTWRI